MERIGFIGLGAMGKPMTRNLMKAVYPVSVLTRTRSKIEDLLDDGAAWCDTPKEIAQKSDVVITMLPETLDVEQVFRGRGGVFEGAAAGTLLIDMSTVSPVAVRKLAREAECLGCDFLDAPVSGGDIGAQKGTLSIMVGGREPAFRRALPVFQAMGKTILHIGDSGAGQTTKAANQILTAVTIEAISEAMVFIRKAGVDPAKAVQALMGGSASSRLLETHGKRMIERNFKPGFRMRLHRKDLDITLEAGREYGTALPVTAQVRALMNEAIEEDRQGDLDNSSFVLRLEKLSNPADKRP